MPSVVLCDYKDEFNITIKLIKDGNPNAYWYDENDCDELKSITSEWYDTAMELKECNKPDKYGIKIHMSNQ